MATKGFIHSMLLLAVAAAGVALITGGLHFPFAIAGRSTQTVADPADPPERSQEQAILHKIRRLEALGQLEQLAAPVTIPFDYVGGHILISAQIHGLDTPKTLIVDSGMRSTLLDRDVVSHQALSESFVVDRHAVYGLLDRVSLAAADFYQVGTFAAEFSAPGQPLYCLSDSGVIGASMMRHAIWQIDYQQRTLTVADSIADLDHVADAIAIPFNLVNWSPAVTFNLGNNQTVQVLVDTGWGGSIHLASQNLVALDIEQFKETSIAEGLVETLRGLESVHQKVLQIPTLSLESLTLKNFPVLVSEGENAQSSSLLGNEFLEHFIVTLDWSTHQLYLEPVAPVSKLYPEAPAYGFQSLVYNHHLLITGLSYPSPAADVGLQIGDQIVAINDDTYTHISNEQSCAFVRSPVGEHYTGSIAMTVERKGRLFNYTIAPGTTIH